MKYEKRPLEKEGRFLIDRRRPWENRTALAGEVPLWWLAPPPCPVGSMSLDSRVAGLSYESSSFATLSSRGHNKAPRCTCQQKLDTKLKKLGIKIEYLYKAQ